MRLDRRTLLAASSCALVAGLVPVGRAPAAEIKSLLVVSPLGKPSLVWTAIDLVRPALEKELGCDVAIQPIPGHDGFDAINAILEPKAGEARLFEGSVMGAQYAGRIAQNKFRIESLTPIVKLTKGFSVTLFTKRGGSLRTWRDLATVKPLKVSSLERATAGYVAELMMERKGGIATEVIFRSAPEVVEDVLTGRSDAGIRPTIVVAKQLDQLQPIVSFGAARNAFLNQTPTFAEVTGNPKLAFTESVGVFAPPRMKPSLAALLTKAFVSAGEDQDVIDAAEAADIPLAVSGPQVLIETMKRNERVLQRVLG